MCEERAIKRGTSARLARIQHARLRARMARIHRQQIRESIPALTLIRPELIRPEPIRLAIAVAPVPPRSGGACPDHGPTSPTPGVHMPNFVYQNAQQQIDPNINNDANDEEWYKYRTHYQTKRDNLMEIAMRTVMLMRQNQQLQQKLAALQAETKTFMQSVANHPPRPQGPVPPNLAVHLQRPIPQNQAVDPQNQRANPQAEENHPEDPSVLNKILHFPYEIFQIVNEPREEASEAAESVSVPPKEVKIESVAEVPQVDVLNQPYV